MSSKKIVIVGAGFAGLATAYYLAKSGAKEIIIIEQERKLGGHASGRNAGMIRQAVSDQVTARLAVDGRNLLAQAAKTKWLLDWQEGGSLLLASGASTKELDQIKETLRKENVDSKELSAIQATQKVALLENGDFAKALFCPSDASLEINKLLSSFLRELKSLGVQIVLGQSIQSIKSLTNHSFQIQTNRHSYEASKIVNAAGAWAGKLAQKAGAFSVPFKAYRRHLFEGDFKEKDSKAWPFTWDLTHDIYFRPIKNGLLISPCDKTAVDRKYVEARQEKIDLKMKNFLRKKLDKFLPNFKTVPIGQAKSGLRTMTKDGRFVIGEDPKLKNFYWVAGLGGHGVTTCLAVGRLASDLVLGKACDQTLVKALSPNRFVKK